MSGDIVFGIKLKYDGKDVTGGAAISREQFKQIAVDARKAGEATAGSFTSAAQGVRSMSAQLDQARTAVLSYLGGTQAVNSARWILDQASAMQQLDARLKVATSSTSEYAHAQAGVFEVANRWGAAVDETARTFARLNPVIAQLGGNSATTLKMMDGLGASLRLSGASTAETTAVLLQFSQAMGSGRVGGDEFRSMMENAEPLMRAVGKELGKTTGELRQMAEDGKLTSSVFGNALLPAIDKLTKQAAQIPLGISQAWQVLENNLKRDFGREFTDQGSAVGATIKSISDHSGEAATAVHGLADDLVFLGKAGLALGAGAGAAWIAKEGQAAIASAQAFMTARAAQAALRAETLAAVEADIARLRATQALVAADFEFATAQRAETVATMQATRAMGVHSAAIAANAEATAAHKAAVLLMMEADRTATALKIEMAAAEKALAAARVEGAAKTTLAGAAMTALGGPIGAVTFALTAGAAAWAFWGDSAESAADKAKKSIDAALDRADRRAKEAKFGAGELGQDREALTLIQAQLADARRTADTAIYEHIRESARDEVRRLESEEARIKASVAQAQNANPSPGGKPLSAAGEWGKLTESLKWREKIVKKYDEDLLNLQTSYADRWREAAEKDRPALLRNQQAALAAMAQEHKAALESLPDAKEGKATADALAEARIHAAEAASKRVLEVLKHEHEQYRISTGAYLNAMAAVKGNAIGQEIAAVQAKLAAATKESERIPLQEKIKELKAQLAALPAETSAAFEDAEVKAREALARLAAVAGKSLDPLTQAGIQFSKDFGAVMQTAATDGREDIIEAGRSAWAAMAGKAQFDAAKQEFEALFEALRLELDAVRQAAERDGGVLTGLRADRETEAIKSRLLPALEAARQKMDEFAGSSLENKKFSTSAAREVQKTLSEVAPHWRQASDDIERSLTDALMRGFENGQSLGENFLKTLAHTFGTAVLKIPVQAIVTPVMAAVRRAFDGGGSGGGIGLPPGGGGLYDAFALSGAGESLGLSQVAAIQPMLEVPGIAAATELTGIGTGIGAALPWIGGGLAVASMLGMFEGDGAAQRSGRYVSPFAGSNSPGDPTQGNMPDGSRYNYLDNRWFSADMNPAQDAFDAKLMVAEDSIISKLGLSSAQIAAVNAQLDAISGRSYNFGMEHTDPTSSGAFQAIEADRLQAIATGLGMSLKDLQDQMSGATKTAKELAAETKAQADAANQAKAAGLLGNMGATLGALDAVTGLRSGLMSAAAGIRGGNTYDSRMSGLRSLLADETDISRQVDLAGQMKDLVLERYSAEKSAIEANRDAATQAAEALRQALRSVGDYAQGLLVGNLSPLTNKQRLDAADSQYLGLLSKANAGDLAAIGGLSGAAGTYLEQAQVYSPGAYSSTFAGVQSALAALGLSAGAVSDATDWQAQLLNVDNQAVGALNGLTSFTEDWTLNLETLLVNQTAEFEKIGLKLADVVTNLSTLDKRIDAVLSVSLGQRLDKVATAVTSSAQLTARAMTDVVKVVVRN